MYRLPYVFSEIRYCSHSRIGPFKTTRSLTTNTAFYKKEGWGVEWRSSAYLETRSRQNTTMCLHDNIVGQIALNKLQCCNHREWTHKSARAVNNSNSIKRREWTANSSWKSFLLLNFQQTWRNVFADNIGQCSHQRLQIEIIRVLIIVEEREHEAINKRRRSSNKQKAIITIDALPYEQSNSLCCQSCHCSSTGRKWTPRSQRASRREVSPPKEKV